MFKDIGYKIETVASVVCAIGIGISLVVGLGLALVYEQMVLGIIVALGGMLISWLSTILMYGFGTLVRTNEEMNEKIYQMNENLDQLVEISERQRVLTSVLVKLTRNDPDEQE